MIIIENTLISDDIYLEMFVCDVPVCKGGCCIEGEAGAPLEEKETIILQEIFPVVRPFMIDEGIETVDDVGFWTTDRQGEYVTPLVGGNQCAYVFYDGHGIAMCAIEKAHEQGLTDFQKPVSCHLYPVRITSYPSYDALNYHRWPICNCARKKGKQAGVSIYRFVKDALIRKYGQDWYSQLDEYVRYVGEGGS